METEYTKKSEHEIGVVEVIPEKIIPAETLPEKVYDYNFLIGQRSSIITQWDEQLAQKQKEIDEINTKRAEEIAFVEKLISEAEKLGITEKKVEPLPVELTEPI